MKVIAYAIAGALGVLGFVFVVGSQGMIARLAVGAVLFAAGIALVVAVRLRPKVVEHRVVQKIDLSGAVAVQDLTCRKCGASLSQDALAVRAGAVFVSCRYCDASYQLEEAPKW